MPDDPFTDPEANIRSIAHHRHAALVDLIACTADGNQLLNQHVAYAGRCRSCQQTWPCDGRRLAEQVVELQQQRGMR